MQRQLAHHEGKYVMAKKPKWKAVQRYLTRSSKDPESLARGVGLGLFVDGTTRSTGAKTKSSSNALSWCATSRVHAVYRI